MPISGTAAAVPSTQRPLGRRRKLQDTNRRHPPPSEAMGRRSRKNDASILRGAEIIREHLFGRPYAKENSSFEKDFKGPTVPISEVQDHDDDDNDEPDDNDDEEDVWSLPSFSNQFPRSDPSMMPLRPNGDSSVLTGPSPQSTMSFPTRGDASEWAELSTLDGLRSATSPKSQPQEVAPPSSGGSVYTYMGRDRKIKTKTVTYLLEPLESFDDKTYQLIEGEYFPDDADLDDVVSLVQVDSPQKSPIALPSTTSPLNPTPKHETRTELMETRQGPPSPKVIQPPVAKAIPVMAMSSRDFTYVPDVTFPSVLSPLDVDYDILMQDPAYRHAQRAGLLWQSLVGQHVRFPSAWWNGARSPPLGVAWEGPPDNPWSSPPPSLPKWQYLSLYTERSHGHLRKVVRHRGAPGRILLHMVVLDLLTKRPVQDVAVGCIHPNARGVRETDRPDPQSESSRLLWMAIRRRSDQSVSIMDPLWSRGGPQKNALSDITTKATSMAYKNTPPRQQRNQLKPMNTPATSLSSNSNSSPSSSEAQQTFYFYQSPLGSRRVTNTNVRAVFGEKPPLETIFIPESELYERLSGALGSSSPRRGGPSPPLVLLQEFVFA